MSTLWEAASTSPELRADEVHIWSVGLDLAPARVKALARCLSPDERQRADRFVHKNHRARFIVARGVLRQLLGEYLARDPVALTFSYGEHGKPDLLGGALEFNMSHSHELALYAVASGRVLGVDIEWPRPRVEYEQIAARFFSPQEQAALMGRPAAERHAAFYNIWTRKEAYLKARGDGISAGLDTFSVSLGAEAELLHSDEGAAEAARWQLMALAPAPGYVAALCATNDGWRPRCFSWNG